MSIHVRPATRADLPDILAIYNDAVLTTTASYDYEPSTLEARAAWFDAHEQEDMPVFVAVDETGEIVGWSSLSSFRPRWGYRFTVEDSVYVAADRRGQGIGRLLMAPVVAAARERGKHSILAVIDAASDASIRLHAAFGFQQVGYLREVGYKFDRWLDLVFMQLLLDEPRSGDERYDHAG
jgi:L-amino acid N-acyltransferase YncA